MNRNKATNKTQAQKSVGVTKQNGVFIPQKIWRNSFLSTEDKVLWAEINSSKDLLKEGCCLSNEELGKRIGLTARRTQELIEAMKDMGFIEQENISRKERVLIAVVPDEEKA